MGSRLVPVVKTINAAVKKAKVGAVIFVEPGVYNESVRIDRVVELVGRSRTTVVIQGDGVTNAIAWTAASTGAVNTARVESKSSSSSAAAGDDKSSDFPESWLAQKPKTVGAVCQMTVRNPNNSPRNTVQVVGGTVRRASSAVEILRICFS